jgi:hypothetical protein
MPVQYGGDKITFSDGSTVGSGWSGFKNRIINGAMMIDQRNAGASVALPTGEVYSIDRFIARFSAVSYSITQSQSSVAPTGFKNSLFLNVTTGGTATSGVRGLVATKIEGYNFADFGYGASGASTFTMSFWVRSSLTGTFSGSFQNIDVNRSYVFTYSVSAANTWEQKTITVVGDTTGTWNTTNGIGLTINFDLGNGSDLKTGTTGSWISGDYRGATGSVAPFTSSGATFYITGVQLEKGSTATSFDYRSYSAELAMCQRYCVRYGGTSNNEDVNTQVIIGYNSTSAYGAIYAVVPMRATPSVSSGNVRLVDQTNSLPITSIVSSGGAYSGSYNLNCGFNVSSGVVQYRPYALIGNNNSSAFVILSAEL